MKLFTLILLTVFLSISLLQAKPSYSDTTIYISNISPWMTGEDKKCLDGLICDFFKQLLKDTKIVERYKYESLPRANERFYNGEQFIALFPYNKDFTSKYHLIGEVLSYDVGLLSLKNKPAFNSQSDSICITRNNPHKVPSYQYMEVNTYEQCLGMLTKGRIGFVLITDVEFKHHYQRPLLNSQYSFQKLYDIPLWLYLNKNYHQDSLTYKAIVQSYDNIKQSSS